MPDIYSCLIADEMHESVLDLLRDIGVRPVYKPGITRAQIIEEIASYDILFIRSKTRVDRALLENAPKLRVVGRAGAGIDNLDEAYIAERGIEIINAPEGNRDAVAEQTVGMLLSLFHNIVKAHLEVIAKKWDREGNRGVELAGKTVGIIGYGNMGSALAERLSAFGCTVLAYDKYRDNYADRYCKAVELDEIYKSADVLSMHVPLTDETRAWVDEEFFGNFHKQIYFLNLARGEVVSLKALKSALKEKKVLGAALDVLENEKLKTLDNEQSEIFDYLCHADNVIMTPHIGGWSQESYFKINKVLIQKLEVALKLKG
jgi:D-3-phosphoglycerate dehydrogenase